MYVAEGVLVVVKERLSLSHRSQQLHFFSVRFLLSHIECSPIQMQIYVGQNKRDICLEEASVKGNDKCLEERTEIYLLR